VCKILIGKENRRHKDIIGVNSYFEIKSRNRARKGGANYKTNEKRNVKQDTFCRITTHVPYRLGFGAPDQYVGEHVGDTPPLGSMTNQRRASFYQTNVNSTLILLLVAHTTRFFFVWVARGVGVVVWFCCRYRENTPINTAKEEHKIGERRAVFPCVRFECPLFVVVTQGYIQ